MSEFTERIAEYVRERYRARVFVPLAALLAVVGPLSAGSGERSLSDAIVGLLIAYLTVLAFRVWDDLEDLPRDRVDHPTRVTVRARSLAPFVTLGVAAVGLALVLMMARANTGRSVIALAAAAAVLLAWYRTSRGRDVSRVLGAHIVLLKYPAIAYAAAAPSSRDITTPESASLVTGLIVVYLAICVHEMSDDPRLRDSRPAIAVSIVEMGLLVFLAVDAVHAALSVSRLNALAGGSIP